MNYFGFSIQSTNNDLPLVNDTITAIKSEEEIMLERYGLSWTSIESSGGNIAADNMTNILRIIEDDSITLTTRVPIASALLTWQSSVSRELRSITFEKHFFKMLEMIRLNLIEPNDYQNTNQAFGNQKPTYYIALLLQRETQQSVSFRDKIQNDVISVIQYVLKKNIDLSDMDSDGNETPPSIRADCIKCLMRCLPTKGKITNVYLVLDW